MLLHPALSKLTLLSTLNLHRTFPSQPDELRYDSSNAEQVICNFTGLTNLELSCIVDCIPRHFSKLCNLRTLLIEGEGEAWSTFDVQPSFSRCRKLGYLGLRKFDVPADANWLGAMAALACLPSLSSLMMEDVALDDVTADCWAFGSSLEDLSIAECNLREVPSALISHTSICMLDMAMNGLTELPAGSYLEHLTSLNIIGNKFRRFPEALASASSLRVLEFSKNEPWVDLNRLGSSAPAM